MNYIPILLEWTGTFLALTGSCLMASQKLSPTTAWKLWALSHLFHSVLFLFYTHQYGLLYVQFVGLTITLTGLWQWRNPSDISQASTRNQLLMNILFFLSLIGLFIVCFLTINILFYFTFEKLEWIGALLAVSAGILLASKHPLMNFAWPIWIIGNFVLFIFTSYTKQWGLATLQVGFAIINIYGCYIRFLLKTEK